MNNINSSNGRTNISFFLPLSVLAIILFFNLFFLLGLNPPDLQENRLLAERPSIPKSRTEWASIAARADAYLSDHFPPRTYMIGYLNYLRYSMGYSGSTKVMVGKQGWMFYNDGSRMAKTLGRERLNTEELRNWVDGFKQRMNYVSEKGGQFYMLMAPVKEDIFPEFRPSWAPHERVTTEFDEFVSETSKAGIDRLIDPRPALLAVKPQQEIWHKFDTHWNGLGAYQAYSVLMKRIAQDFPGLEPLPITHFAPSVLAPYQQPRDLSLMLGVSTFVKHGGTSFATDPIHDPNATVFLSDRRDWTAPQILVTDNPSGPVLLWIRDSFGTELLPLMKRHFSKIIMVHLQDGFFRKDLIDTYRPSIVLFEVIEVGARHTMSHLPELETETAKAKSVAKN